MSELALIQEHFQDYLLTANKNIFEFITPAKNLTAEASAAVYYDAYRLRLVEIVSQDFPKLLAFLGEEKFTELARQYVMLHPSEHYSARYFSRKFPEFLAARTDGQAPFWRELAIFDWLVSEVLDAKDDTVLSLEALQAVPGEDWPNLKFRLHASVRSVDLAWNTGGIWQAFDEDKTPHAPKQADGHTTWLIWRREGVCACYQPLTEVQTYLLDALHQGKSFAAICIELCAFMDEAEVAPFVVECLQAWIQDEIVAEYKI